MKRLVSAALCVAAVAVSVGVVAAVAGPILYRDVIVRSASDNPTVVPMITDASAQALTDAANRSGVWALAPDSSAGYAVDAVLDGTPVAVTGQTTEVSGSMTVNAHSVTATTVTVDISTIITGDAATDRYFRDTALQAGLFPTASFTLTSPTGTPGTPVDGQTDVIHAIGDLTLHGITRPIAVDLQTSMTTAGATVVGSIPITFSDYGVRAPDLGFVKVDGTGSISFSLVAATQ
ncbi:hypothetical protein BH09ACT6_BH09ACT6_01480 [soil metagenome]